MAQKQTAIVVVSKSWIDSAVRHLINDSRESRSTGDTHIVYADLEDASDQHGLWLKNVKTSRLKTDGSEIAMRFMIPWAFVVALGVVAHGVDVKPGFAEGTLLGQADQTNQSSSGPND